jgi:Uma2 family endonuclease
MVQMQSRPSLLTEEDAEFLRTVEDDTEEAPWMVMGDPQIQAATGLYWSLRIYAAEQKLPWYVGSMLPILYPRPGLARNGQIAPDVLVAFVQQRVRHSYDLEEEGQPPAFVLEVISPSSVLQDTIKKRRTYRILGVQEYALFAPEPKPGLPPLQGYRRSADGRFLHWPLDAQGGLYSRVLGLRLVAEGLGLHAVQSDGTPLLTPEQESEARRQAEAAQRQAEALVARLQAELERYRRPR